MVAQREFFRIAEVTDRISESKTCFRDTQIRVDEVESNEVMEIWVMGTAREVDACRWLYKHSGIGYSDGHHLTDTQLEPLQLQQVQLESSKS